jgi:hypothetical protein
MFVPQPLEPVQVDKQTVKLYPVVDLSMKPPKCTHAFQTNKTVLSASGINRGTMLDTLGVQINLSDIVNSILGNWNHHFVATGVTPAPNDAVVSQQHRHSGEQHHRRKRLGYPIARNQWPAGGLMQASLFCPGSTQP